jgi:hypothetical protein
MFSNRIMAEKPDTHASVEFYADGHWIASDPAFNVMFTQNSRFLSYAELYRAIRNNQPYSIVSNGFPLIKGRRLNEYYVPLSQLMRFVVIDPAHVHGFGSDKRHDYKLETLPGSWGGLLVQDGGRKVPAGHPDGPDREASHLGFLAKGLLR